MISPWGTSTGEEGGSQENEGKRLSQVSSEGGGGESNLNYELSAIGEGGTLKSPAPRLVTSLFRRPVSAGGAPGRWRMRRRKGPQQPQGYSGIKGRSSMASKVHKEQERQNSARGERGKRNSRKRRMRLSGWDLLRGSGLLFWIYLFKFFLFPAG